MARLFSLFFLVIVAVVGFRPSFEVEIKKSRAQEISDKSVQNRPADKLLETKTTKQERLYQSVRAMYSQVAGEKENNAYFCKESEYFDYTSDSCQKCSTVCQFSSPKICQLYCPWSYAESLVLPKIDQLWVAIHIIAGLLAFLFFIMIIGLFFLSKLRIKQKRKRRLPSYNSAEKLQALKRNNSSLCFDRSSSTDEKQGGDQTESSDSVNMEHHTQSGSDADDERRPVTFNAIPPTTEDY